MKVGIAKVDLTPEMPVTIDGFGSRIGELSEGVAHDIYANCAVLDNGETRVCMMGLDLLAVDDYLLVPVRQAAEKLGIPAANVMLNASHGHASPNVTPCRTFMRSYQEEYLEATREKLCEVMAAAVEDLAEARLDYTVGSCTTGANRRTIWGMSPNPSKPIDLDVPVLRVMSPEGEVRGIVFSYACHPVCVCGMEIDPDFPGYARDLVAEKLPGCEPIFLQGCGGDVNTRCRGLAEKVEGLTEVGLARELGRELGRAVCAALCGELQPLGEELAVNAKYLQIPFGPQPTEEQVAEAEQSESLIAHTWGEAVRRVWDSGHKLPYQLPIEVQVANIGGLCVVAMACETCVEMGLHIKEMLSERTVMTLGYTNGAWDYFAPENAHTEKGYETGYEVYGSFHDTIWPWVQPLGLSVDSESILLETIGEMVEELDG